MRFGGAFGFEVRFGVGFLAERSASWLGRLASGCAGVRCWGIPWNLS